MATFLNHYPEQRVLNGVVYTRSILGLTTEAKCKEYQKEVSKIYNCKIYWTGGEKLSDGTTRQSFFLLVSKKPSVAYDEILYRVNTQRGAPMGRFSNNENEKPVSTKIFDRQVILSQGYDKGGAYWGTPSNLRVEFNLDLTYVRFYRTS
jgi:hypothetical protein